MALDRISLSHFRNHQLSELSDTRTFNLLIGENGVGKTNVLEALSLLAPGRGLRRAPMAEMAGPEGPACANPAMKARDWAVMWRQSSLAAAWFGSMAQRPAHPVWANGWPSVG